MKNDILQHSVDFEAIRQDFPAIQRLRAYLDTAFIGLMPQSVKQAHEEFLEERIQFGPIPNDMSILRVWLQRAEAVRAKLASLMGAKDHEIALTYCTGCGPNITLNGINWQQGDNVVTDDLCYPTDIHILNALSKKRGIEVRIARNENGSVSPDAFERLIDKHTRALVVSHINYLNGFRHNLERLADIIHKYGGYLVVDGTQSLGTVKVDVKKEKVDVFSCAPYKWLLGPLGVGFLYMREDLIPLIEPDRLGALSTSLMETLESPPLRTDAGRFEYGTLHFEGLDALGAALDYINKIGIDSIEKRNLALVAILRQRLHEKGAKFFTPENNLAPILTIFRDNEKEFGVKMRETGIAVTARYWKEGQVRISPHFYNNEDDIEVFLDAFTTIIDG